MNGNGDEQHFPIESDFESPEFLDFFDRLSPAGQRAFELTRQIAESLERGENCLTCLCKPLLAEIELSSDLARDEGYDEGEKAGLRQAIEILARGRLPTVAEEDGPPVA